MIGARRLKKGGRLQVGELPKVDARDSHVWGGKGGRAAALFRRGRSWRGGGCARPGSNGRAGGWVQGRQADGGPGLLHDQAFFLAVLAKAWEESLGV